LFTLHQLQQAVAGARPQGDWLRLLSPEDDGQRAHYVAYAAELCGYETLNHELERLVPAFDLAGYADMLSQNLLIARDSALVVRIVLGTPLDAGASIWLASQGIQAGSIALSDPLLLRAYLDSFESSFSAVADAVASESGQGLELVSGEELTLTAIQSEASPAIKLVNSTVFDALRYEASDIHLESVPSGMAIKFRIDGVLTRIAELNSVALAEQAIARVKVLAELDIAEKRIPQDGRFRVTAKGREIDIRVSIMPSIHGEDAVLRILDKKALTDSVQRLTLNSLGFDDETIRSLRRLASEPYGMMLVTGPTGSGKTTTLYAALTEVNRGEDKLITIEDPVEYQLPGVLQIPVNEKKGLTFAVGLRSILRHDPDKILVGEIRDPETAQIAVQSALTGHMVFTSVHANNTFDVIGRFMHMGVDPYSFVSSLSGVVAQRLLRQNCPHCSEAVAPDEELLRESGIADPQNYQFRAGRGCAQCRNTGYRGRRAIAEVLRLTDEVRELIIGRATIRTLKAQARSEGTRFLRDVALDLVRDGHTTLEEANRVTFVA